MRNRELTDRTKSIVEYVFDHPELTYAQLGTHFGITHGRISQILRNERVVSHFPVLATRRYRSMIPKAMKAQSELIDQKTNPMVRDKASARVLESANILSLTPQVSINVFSGMTNEELERQINQTKQLPADTVDGELA